jgi:hypothetical protein
MLMLQWDMTCNGFVTFPIWSFVLRSGLQLCGEKLQLPLLLTMELFVFLFVSLKLKERSISTKWNRTTVDKEIFALDDFWSNDETSGRQKSASQPIGHAKSLFQSYWLNSVWSGYKLVRCNNSGKKFLCCLTLYFSKGWGLRHKTITSLCDWWRGKISWVFLPGSPCLRGTPGADPRRRFSTWVGSWLTRKHSTGVERPARDQHSSLFGPFVSYEEKESFITLSQNNFWRKTVGSPLHSSQVALSHLIA